MVDIVALRMLIDDRLAALDAENRLGQDAQAVVTLDQQSVGRLSRQDALLSQSMAKASQARRDVERSRLCRARERIGTDPDFGHCEDCGDEIAEARLRFDPGVTRCISCARG